MSLSTKELSDETGTKAYLEQHGTAPKVLTRSGENEDERSMLCDGGPAERA